MIVILRCLILNNKFAAPDDEQEFQLPSQITELPIYKWRNCPPENSSWGISQLAGLETILYGINQSLTDEDCTIVFQGLGMYITNARPPLDPATGEVTDWNIGPMQVIEIGQDQMFNRVTGITDVSPFQNHMNYLDEKGLQESAGTPAVAIGKIDVNTVASGIALKMELMPLLAANLKENELVNVNDQLLFDLTTMWFPAYEQELFAGTDMTDISVVCIFDDPIPVDRDAKIQETILLETSNLILTKMAIAKLRELGWEYPKEDDQGNPLTDDDIVDLLNNQTTTNAQSAMGGPQALGLGSAGQTDQFGNPINQGQPQTDQFGNPLPQGPQPQTISLNGAGVGG